MRSDYEAQIIAGWELRHSIMNELCPSGTHIYKKRIKQFGNTTYSHYVRKNHHPNNDGIVCRVVVDLKNSTILIAWWRKSPRHAFKCETHEWNLEDPESIEKAKEQISRYLEM